MLEFLRVYVSSPASPNRPPSGSYEYSSEVYVIGASDREPALHALLGPPDGAQLYKESRSIVSPLLMSNSTAFYCIDYSPYAEMLVIAPKVSNFRAMLEEK